MKNKNKPNIINFFSRHKNKNNQCFCCGKKMCGSDKKQEQHIYPNWWYSLFEKNNKGHIVLKKNSVKNGELDSCDVIIQGRKSNFWCNDCEEKSSRLDSDAKNILFGNGKKLKVGDRPFCYKTTFFWIKIKEFFYRMIKKQNVGTIYFSEKESVVLARWVRSIALRVFLNESNLNTFKGLKMSLDLFSKELYKGMLGSNSEVPVIIGIDSSLKFKSVYPTTVKFMGTIKHPFGCISVVIGPLICFIKINPKRFKLVDKDNKELPFLSQTGTKVPILIGIDNDMILDFFNNDPTVMDVNHPALVVSSSMKE